MANGHENLIPGNKRSQEEARELGKIGGIKSGEVRREKKMMREIWTEYLETGEWKAKRKNPITGVEEEVPITKENLPINVFRKAMNGDVNSLKFVSEFLEGTKTGVPTNGESITNITVNFIDKK